MPVFVTYLPDQTFSRLVAVISYENIFRLGFKNNLHLEAVFGKIVYVQILVNIIVIFFLRCLKIPKISAKTFPCLFWSPAITLEPICESDSFPQECPVSAYLLKLTLVE